MRRKAAHRGRHARQPKCAKAVEMLLRALALALAAADQARWVGRSKLELARSMHDRHYHRAGGPKAPFSERQ